MIFDKDYYVRSKISNYEDYRKKKFDDLACEIKEYLNLDESVKILDYGAATGGLISALKSIGVTNIIGTDISYWAINFGRKQYSLSKTELQHYNRQLLEEKFDYIFILDVLEHIHYDELENTFELFDADHLLVRIPVSLNEGEDFALEVSKFDKTHIQCHCCQWWIDLFAKYDYKLQNYINLPTMYNSDGVLVGLFRKASE